MKIRIYYHHTDCGGVVYYGTYLQFFEQARTEHFEKKGFSIKGLTEQGVLFVVYRQEVDYKAPARYGDILEVDTRVPAVRAAKIEFEHTVTNQHGSEVCRAKTVMVCVDSHLKPRPLPEEVKQGIA